MDQVDTVDQGQAHLQVDHHMDQADTMDLGQDCHMDQVDIADWGQAYLQVDRHMDQADTVDLGQDCHMDQVDIADVGQASVVIIEEALVSNFPINLESSLDTIAAVGTPRTIVTGMDHILQASHSVQDCPINRIVKHLVVN